MPYDDVTYLSAVVGPEVADRDVAAGVGLMAVVLDQRNAVVSLLLRLSATLR